MRRYRYVSPANPAKIWPWYASVEELSWFPTVMLVEVEEEGFQVYSFSHPYKRLLAHPMSPVFADLDAALTALELL